MLGFAAVAAASASACSNAACASVLNQGCCKNKFQPENSEQSAVAAVHK